MCFERKKKAGKERRPVMGTRTFSQPLTGKGGEDKKGFRIITGGKKKKGRKGGSYGKNKKRLADVRERVGQGMNGPQGKEKKRPLFSETEDHGDRKIAVDEKKGSEPKGKVVSRQGKLSRKGGPSAGEEKKKPKPPGRAPGKS